MSQAKGTTIVIRRIKKVSGGGHHGGAWKVAYADFVTAMMAFFLVMWLVGATTNKQRAAISEYFKQSSPVPGNSVSPNQGPNGPGGASTSMIKLGGEMDVPRGAGNDPLNKPSDEGKGKGNGGEQDQPPDAQTAEKIAKQAEHERLEVLMQNLEEAIGKSQALKPFKDQLLLDITSEGLRIQIVDEQNRPMFDMGKAALKPYTTAILSELAQFINKVPNKISITGHTDITPYSSENGYTNWELSAERANAARRALVAGGMSPDKISRVVGLSSSVLFDKENPQDPINRRISIVVMTDAAEKAALAPESVEALAPGKISAVVDEKGKPQPAADASKHLDQMPKRRPMEGLASHAWTH